MHEEPRLAALVARLVRRVSLERVATMAVRTEADAAVGQNACKPARLSPSTRDITW